MLEHAGLPCRFWAVVHATDIRIKFLAPRSDTKTSHELFPCVKALVDHLRVFCCLVWAYVPREKRQKLDSKSKEGILLRCLDCNRYKVWINSQQQSVVVWHCYFDETNFPARSVSDDDIRKRFLLYVRHCRALLRTTSPAALRNLSRLSVSKFVMVLPRC